MTDAELALEAIRLKEVSRAGWVRAGVPDPESVAAHAWGTAFLALLRCPPGLDRGRVLAMALLHDLAEVETGDITPADGVPRDEKARRERIAIDRLLADHPELRALWEEAEARVTPEARFVKEMDRLDLGVQARRYMTHTDVSELLAVGKPALDKLDAG